MARPRTDIQPRILHAARARFVKEGVDGASLRAIARDAGTNIGMIYYYFPTKDDLFFGVVEEVYAAVVADLEAVLAHDEGFEARVKNLYRRIAHMTPIEADVFLLVAREAVVSSERLGRLVRRFELGHFALLARLVAAGRAEGALRELPLPVMMIATAVLGIAPQMMLRALGSERPFGDAAEPGEALADQLVRVLLGGIARPGDPPSS